MNSSSFLPLTKPTHDPNLPHPGREGKMYSKSGQRPDFSENQRKRQVHSTENTHKVPTKHTSKTVCLVHDPSTSSSKRRVRVTRDFESVTVTPRIIRFRNLHINSLTH